MPRKKHKTFFGKIFGSLWDFIKSPFDNADHTLLEIAIVVTNKVKNFLNSGVVDILTSVIPGNIDDTLVEILKKKVPIILADQLALKSLSDPNVDPKDVAKELIDTFGGIPDEKKEKFYTTVAAEVFIFLQQHKNGEKITFGQAAAFVETAYQAWKASNKE